MNKSRLLLLVFSLSGLSIAQTLSNVEIINKLVDKSITRIDSSLDNHKEKIPVILSIPLPLDQLKTKIIQSFQTKGYSVNPTNPEAPYLNYALTNVSVLYEDSFTDGLFGDLKTGRKIKYDGSYFIARPEGDASPILFNFNSYDTVKVDNIPILENPSLPFTQSKIPQPPILSNLMEPIIVVGTLITTIILLFTVRSK